MHSQQFWGPIAVEESCTKAPGKFDEVRMWPTLLLLGAAPWSSLDTTRKRPHDISDALICNACHVEILDDPWGSFSGR